MEPFLVIGDLYNRIFYTEVSTPEVLVDYHVWNRIAKSLPPDYKLPHFLIQDALI